MAPGIGLGISGVVESIGSAGGAGGFTAALSDDFFFEEDGDQNLQPKYSFVDNNDIWDLDGDSNIIPASTPNEEGWFDVDGNGDIIPKA
jgi:hypothetical protein